MDPDTKKLTVLFIGGVGRSGSTLLDNLLGQIEGYVAVGELNEIWRAGFKENKVCGCGERFLDCNFWKSVRETSFPRLDPVELENILEIQRQVGRTRHIPQNYWIANSQSPVKKVRQYSEFYRKVLEGIRDVSGARVIVDSSKTPAQAYLLSIMDDVDVHIIHLVRDSRAVAFSWQRRKKIVSSESKEVCMTRIGPVRSAISWNLRNYLIGTLGYTRPGNVRTFSFMRYEDLVAQPQLAISALSKSLGFEIGKLTPPFTSDFTFLTAQVNHTLEGNPSKFHRGLVTIKLDEEWHGAMSMSDRTVVTMLTLPYLLRYGYPCW